MDIRKFLIKQASTDEIQKKRRRDEDAVESMSNQEPQRKRQRISNNTSLSSYPSRIPMISNIDLLLNKICVENTSCYLDKESANNLQILCDDHVPSNNNIDIHSIYLINGNKLLNDKYCAFGFGFEENGYLDPNYSKNYQLAKCYNYPSKLTLKQLQKQWEKQFNIPSKYQLIYCYRSPTYKYQRKSNVRRCAREKTTKFFDIDSNENGKIKNIFQTENEYLLLDKRRITKITTNHISYLNEEDIDYYQLSEFTFLSLKYFNISSQTLDFMAFLLIKDDVTFHKIAEFILSHLSNNNINQKFIDLKRYIKTMDDSTNKIRVHSEAYSYKVSMNGTIKDLQDSRDRYSDIKYEKNLFFDINPNHPHFQKIREEFKNKQKMYDEEYIEKFYFDALKYIDDEMRKQMICIKYIYDQNTFNHHFQCITNQQNINKDIEFIVTRSYDIPFWKKIMIKALGLDFNTIHHIEIYNKSSYVFHNENPYQRKYNDTGFVSSSSEFYWQFVQYNTFKNYCINHQKMLYKVDVFLPGQFPGSTDSSFIIPCIYSFEYFKQFKVSDLVKYLLNLFKERYPNKFKKIFDQIDEWKKKKIEYYPFITTGKLHWSHKQYINTFDINAANSYSPFSSLLSSSSSYSNNREKEIDLNQPYRLLLFFIQKNKNLDDEDLYATHPDDEEESDEQDYDCYSHY